MLLEDYSLPIHKSFHQPDLLFGIPKIYFLLIFCVTILLVYLLGVYASAAAVLFYLPCRLISKQDPLLLTIALESLSEVEKFEG
jgi:type IV secretory pathway VirB3-like protein